jgi:hypothetical protein
LRELYVKSSIQRLRHSTFSIEISTHIRNSLVITQKIIRIEIDIKKFAVVSKA